MKENEDKQLEKFIDNIMRNCELETPSADFTSKIITHVLSSKKIDVYVYKPLISRNTFVFIFVGFITLFIYFAINGGIEQDRSGVYLNILLIVKNYLLTSFIFSKVTIYTVLSATVMLFIQITILKSYFNNQIGKS